MSSEKVFITIEETAKLYNVSKRTIWYWISKLKDEGFPQPKRIGMRALVLEVKELNEYQRKRGIHAI